MTRTMLRACTATIPAASPTSFLCQDAGKASIAATRTMVASTPLQPASMETANPFALCNTLPCASTCGSNHLTRPALIAASVSVHGTTNQVCAHGVSSRPNRTACRTRNPRKKRTTGQRMRASTSARLRPSERRVLRKIALDSAQDRRSELCLLLLAAQPHFLVGIGDERSFDQDRGNLRRLEHSEPRLLDASFVQRVDLTDPVENGAADAQAVVDLCRLRHIEHRAPYDGVLFLEVDATDQIRLVL